MKKIYNYLLACSAFVLGACTDFENADTAKVTTITANIHDFQEEDGTRTVIGVDQNDQLSYRWGVGDVLGIYPDQGTQVAFELSAGSLSQDGLSATFDGGAWALKAGHSYYSYFPFSHGCFDPSVDKTCIPVSYLGQQQVDFNDTSNAGQYDFNAAGATSSSTGSLSFNFNRLGALLRIKFELPETGTYQSLVLSTDGDVLPVSGSVDLTAPAIAYAPATYASSLTIDLNNANGTVGQTAYVYMMLPPMTLKTQGKTLTATLNYGSKSTTYSLCTANTTTVNTPDFKADTRYKRDAVYLSGDPAGTMSGGNDEGDEPQDNGHAYVDLGLPSGTLWATCNVGATTPEGYGDYFAWGETITKSVYSWSNYKWCNGSYTTLTKYCLSSSFGNVDNRKPLEAADDAATINWGGDWRMPTKGELVELINFCTWTWTTQNGVNGYKIASKTNDNSIFLPAAGWRLGSDLNYDGYDGDYWSSTPDSYYSDAGCLGFYSRSWEWLYGDRCYGRPVRAVCSKPQDDDEVKDEEEVKVKIVTVDFEGEYFNNLIDAEQYYGPLLYSSKKQYVWQDNATSLNGCVEGDWDFSGTGTISYMFWNGGTAISNYVEADVKNHTSYKEQLNVPASNGSKNFVVAYCNTEISFADGNNHKVQCMDVCPTTYLLGAMLGYDGYASSLEKGGNMTLTISAYKFGEEKASASLDIDFARNGKIMKGWTHVDLTPLGEFNSLKFSMDGSDRNEFGVKHPPYFAFDNVVVEIKYK